MCSAAPSIGKGPSIYSVRFQGIARMDGPVAGPHSARLSSRAEEFHLRALPEPCVNLSIHTAPDVRPLP